MFSLVFRWLAVLLTCASVTFGEEDMDILFPTTKPSGEWWSNAIIYQVYPRSFKDSDGDGIGDLTGLTQQLDYFVELGVEIIWLNPIFKSPMDDMGFDVENHTTIDPIFGTMADFDKLIVEMNKRNLKLLLEIVPNHSSYKCEWFSKSIKKECKYKDYYVWRDALNQDKIHNESVTPIPPNNWLSNVGGSAWSWNADRKQFYLHQFSDKEPDFNARCHHIHTEILDIMEFWLDRGVAGFRFNVVGKLYEHKDFPNEPNSKGRENWPVYYSLDHIYTHDQPETIDMILEWRKFMDDYSKRKNILPRLLTAEAHRHVCVFSLRHYYGNSTNPGAQIPFNFHLSSIVNKDYLVPSVDRAIKFWFEVIPENTPNWVMETHDTDRISSNYGPEMVKVFTALKLAMPGIDVTYYGSEIGMENTYVKPDQVQDLDDSGGKRNIGSRDFARSPMQWNSEENAGFTKAKISWLPVNPNYYKLNVETQRNIPNSNFNFYKEMSQLRRNQILKYGDLQSYNISDTIYIVKRYLPEHGSFLVVMNFGSYTEKVVLSNVVKNLKKNLFVYLTSENLAYSRGSIVSTVSSDNKPLQLRPKSVVVLTDNVDVIKNAAASYKLIGSSFISILLCSLIFTVYFGIFN